jgi:AcrR family transcriptional regulator
VLRAARQVLIEAGYTQFSLRNVAAAAGMHLSNLQYYFRTRDALILRLLQYVEEQYERSYAEKFAALPPDPMPRFVAMVDYLIADIHSAETRRFFIQLWALLDSTDRRARLLNRLYSGHVRNLAAYIGDINPGLPKRVLQQRAAMIAAMIDGMMLMLDDADLFTRRGEESISLAMRRQIVRIATGAA